MDFEIVQTINEEKERWEVNIAGEIDIFNSKAFKDKLIGLMNEKPFDLFIDCENMKYIDSTALGSLVAVYKNVKSNNREMELINVQPNILKLFKITNLDKVFIIKGV